jgi:hypothetical protein
MTHQYDKCITITFGDQAENHVGMQKIGTMHEYGYTRRDLLNVKEKLENIGSKVDFIDLGREEDACVIVIRSGVNSLLQPFCHDGADQILDELLNLEWDKKKYMYGRVCNALARYNLCFDDKDQDPDYENAKGRIIGWSEKVLNLYTLKMEIEAILGGGLVAEGNYYYDIHQCGIGAHGDSERTKVIGARFGSRMPMQWQWYLRSEPVGEKYEINLNHGDIYIMASKAVGTDWKRKNIYTLRHSAGCEKFTNPKKSKPTKK